MKRMAIAFVVVAILAVCVPSISADPLKWHVWPGESIQSAVDGATDGDSIYVHEGVYDEAIEINGIDLNLVAVGAVLLQPSSCTGHHDAVTIWNATVTVDGFEVDASACMSGLYTRGASWWGEGHVDVTFTSNHVYGYKKNGITVNGDLATGYVSGNEVNGSGHDLVYAQNGIQFGYGATGEVTRNTVVGHYYNGADWGAAGILVFESSEVTVQDNTVLDSQTAISVETWCWYVPDASLNRIVKNTINGADWGISIAAYGWDYSSCDAHADNNKIVNNVLVDEENDGFTGIVVSISSDPYWYPTVDNNKVIHNNISGFGMPLDLGGTATKVHANVLP